ncbi:MAG TPA: hypothetical protein VHE99_10035 [Gammaproteobacteria bacterium]|nr:hypothetical protein [Gammaproteobacteria bacterium]
MSESLNDKKSSPSSSPLTPEEIDDIKKATELSLLTLEEETHKGQERKSSPQQRTLYDELSFQLYAKESWTNFSSRSSSSSSFSSSSASSTSSSSSTDDFTGVEKELDLEFAIEAAIGVVDDFLNCFDKFTGPPPQSLDIKSIKENLQGKKFRKPADKPEKLEKLMAQFDEKCASFSQAIMLKMKQIMAAPIALVDPSAPPQEVLTHIQTIEVAKEKLNRLLEYTTISPNQGDAKKSLELVNKNNQHFNIHFENLSTSLPDEYACALACHLSAAELQAASTKDPSHNLDALRVLAGSSETETDAEKILRDNIQKAQKFLEQLRAFTASPEEDISSLPKIQISAKFLGSLLSSADRVAKAKKMYEDVQNLMSLMQAIREEIARRHISIFLPSHNLILELLNPDTFKEDEALGKMEKVEAARKQFSLLLENMKKCLADKESLDIRASISECSMMFDLYRRVMLRVFPAIAKPFYASIDEAAAKEQKAMESASLDSKIKTLGIEEESDDEEEKERQAIELSLASQESSVEQPVSPKSNPVLSSLHPAEDKEEESESDDEEEKQAIKMSLEKYSSVGPSVSPGSNPSSFFNETQASSGAEHNELKAKSDPVVPNNTLTSTSPT